MISGYFFTDFPYHDKQGRLNHLKCLSFVIVHPEFGAIIFDTGSSYNTDQMVTYLKELFNLRPEDFKWVFNTHIHPDHAGANFLFKNATIVFSKMDYMMEDEIADLLLSHGDIKGYFKIHCPGYESFYDDDEIERMRKIIKYCWNPERIGIGLNVKYIEDSPAIPAIIKISRSFGHTLHHYSYIIKHRDKNIIVSGDAVSNRQVIRSDIYKRREEPHMDIGLFSRTLSEYCNYEGIFFPGHDRPFYYPAIKSIRKNVFDLDCI